MNPNNEPWLSVLIPMYNVGAYLPECIESVMSQWKPGVEVLLLDDASTDDTLAQAEVALHRFGDRLQLLQHERNRGLSAARNSLLLQARGSHVWFLDSDDRLQSGALASLKCVLDAQSPDLVMCDYRTFRVGGSFKERLRDRRRKPSFNGPAQILGTNPSQLMRHVLEAGQLHAWTKIARREVWAMAPFPEGRSFEDIAVIHSLLSAAHSWMYVPEAWVGYRVRTGSIATSPKVSSQADLITSISELHASVSARPEFRANVLLRRALDRFCLHRIGTVAAWCHRNDQAQSLPLDTPSILHRMYPQGVRQALDQVSGWGWWQRARRVKRRYRRVGWLT